MFQYVVFICVIAAALAKPGVLSSSVGIAGPAIVSAPSVGIIRTAPVTLGSIGAPLAISGGLLSNGLVSGGFVSGGLISNGLISSGLISNGLVSGGLVNGGLVSGKLLSGGLVSGGLLH